MPEEMVRATTTAQGRGPAGGALSRRARSHLANPLFRNAYALMVNTGATGALGVLYWILAAHYYAAADVGRSSAAISAMMLLSGFTALNLTGMLTRFLPRAGPATRSFVLRTYGASALAAAAITGAFLLTLDHWGPSYAWLKGPGAGIGFIAAVIAWSIFTLQDGVLTALRSAVWIPIENAVFGVLKIILVLGLARAVPRSGVFLSWMIPVGISLVPINALIFGRLALRHVRATQDRHTPPSRQRITRFLAGDYVGALFVLGVVYVVPVVVAARFEPSTYAYFFVAWVIGGVLDLLAVNMAASLTVEGTLEEAELGANSRAALRRTLQILAPIVAATVLLAHPVLGLYGPGYAEHGAPLLQLLALSTLPRALIELHFGGLRAESRTTRLAILQGLRCLLVIGLTLVFTGPLGVAGAGWAVLISQTTVMVVVIPGIRATFTAGDRPAPDRAVAPGAPEVGSLEGAQLVGSLGASLIAPPVAPPGITGAPSKEFREDALPTRPRLAVKGRRSGRGRWPLAGIGLLVLVGLALFLLPLRAVQIDAMNGYGLVSVLPLATLGGAGLLAVAYLLTLALHRPRPVFLIAQLVCLVVCLHGVAAIVENEPRFATAWQHVGFVDYIARTGNVAPDLDARFGWPAFFAVVAFVTRAAGLTNPTVLLRPTPVVAELLYLGTYLLLLRTIRASWQTKWFAAFLLVVANWVGQDYFSPQAFNYLLYLLFCVILLTWFGKSTSNRAFFGRFFGRFRPLRLPLLIRLPRSTPTGELPPRPATPGQRVGLVLLLVGLFVTSTASHQLTPFMMLAAIAALVVARRCELTGLPLLFAVIAVSWISFMAVGYWSGHLGDIFGGVGKVGTNFSTSVQGRVLGADPQHSTVLYARLALGVMMSVLAALGAVRRRLAGIRDRTLFALAVVPLTALGLQSYGGEIGLRIYLFSLPALCALAAALFFGSRVSRPSWLAHAAALGCALIFVGGFLLVRFGNEGFERVTRGEVAAMNYVYQHDTNGAQILWMTRLPGIDDTLSMPWGARDMEKVNYVNTLAPQNPGDVGGLIRALRDLGPNSYLLVNRAQVSYLHLNFGYPSEWGQRLWASLGASPDVRAVVTNTDAVLYEVTTSFPGPVPTAPKPAGFTIGRTPWTPVGLAITVILIALLTVRQVVRVGWPAVAHRRLAPPAVVALLLLLVGFAGVVVERFLYLS